jgi:hypothetical protein
MLFEPVKEPHHYDQHEDHEEETTPGMVIQAEIRVFLNDVRVG